MVVVIDRRIFLCSVKECLGTLFCLKNFDSSKFEVHNFVLRIFSKRKEEETVLNLWK